MFRRIGAPRSRSSFCSLHAEPLEPRRLLAGIESGVLVARGTSSADTISVRRSGGDDVIVTTNGVSQQFDMDDFTGVRLEGLGGNDTFRLIDPLVSPVVRNTTIVGGAGNDTVDYSTRTDALSFVIDPSGQEGAGMTSGAQLDPFTDVETVIGGSGDDTFTYRQFDDPLSGAAASYRLEGRGGNDTFNDRLFSHFDGFVAVTMLGGDGADRFSEESDDRFTNEFFFGEGGNDSVTFYRFNRGVIDGGSGIDTMHFSGSLEEQNTREGFALEDFPGFENATKEFGSIVGTDGPNHLTIFGDGTVVGGGGNDTLVGGNGDNLLDGGAGNDVLSGNQGNDTLDGGADTDTLDGGIGNDTLLNGEVTPPPGAIRILNGVLTADGAWGGEEITVERVAGDDVRITIDDLVRTFDMDDFTGILIRGNNGYDQIHVLQPIVAGSLVRKVTIEGGNGNDSINSGDGDEVIRGGEGNDAITANGGADAIFGGAGNDDLVAGDGRDFVDAGDGDDLIHALDGEIDTVQGGTGSDSASVDATDQRSGIEEEDVGS